MTRSNLSKTSLLVATDLRRGEWSINTATRDLGQLLVSVTEATAELRLAPGETQPVIAAITASLAALSEGQKHLSTSAHGRLRQLADKLDLTVTDFGVGDGKPTKAEAITTVDA